MKLYKYINFDQYYWMQICIERKIYFSLPEQIQTNTNDPNEFMYCFESKSYLFNHLKEILEEVYSSMFSKTCLLSLSKNLSMDLWNSYCSGSGGVIYEFDFDRDIAKSNEFTTGDVEYVHHKIHKVYDFIESRNLKNEKLIRLLRSDTLIHRIHEEFISNFITGNEFGEDLKNHIVNELGFKKPNTYEYTIENEFRLIHVLESDSPDIQYLGSQFCELSKAGLTLKKIYSNNLEKVKKEANPSSEIALEELFF